MENTQTLTYGDKLVGRSFNPSALPVVDRIKELYAGIIDELAAIKSTSDEGDLFYDMAIQSAVTAQMQSVKFVTWKD